MLAAVCACVRFLDWRGVASQSVQTMAGDQSQYWGWQGYSDSTDVSYAYQPGSQPGPAFPTQYHAAQFHTAVTQAECSAPGTQTEYVTPTDPAECGHTDPLASSSSQASPNDGRAVKADAEAGSAKSTVAEPETEDESEGAVASYHPGATVPLSVLAGASHMIDYPGLQKAFLHAASRDRQQAQRWRADLEWDRGLR